MAETNNVVKTDDFKNWKKPELQKWLRIHGLKVTGTKDELVVRVENAKQAGVETVVERDAHEKEITKRAAAKLSTPTEKRAGVNPNSSCTPAGSQARVPRGTLGLLCTIMSQLERES